MPDINLRTFTEVALCHLPDKEIAEVFHHIETGLTSAFSNDAGFFVWTQTQLPWLPVLTQILTRTPTDYVLFDVDVEPDPELEIEP